MERDSNPVIIFSIRERIAKSTPSTGCPRRKRDNKSPRCMRMRLNPLARTIDNYPKCGPRCRCSNHRWIITADSSFRTTHIRVVSLRLDCMESLTFLQSRLRKPVGINTRATSVVFTNASKRYDRWLTTMHSNVGPRRST